MKKENQRITIAEFCGWQQVPGEEAQIKDTIIYDRRFGFFKRRVVRWNQQRAFRGWIIKPGYHQIDIDESRAISTAELLKDYDITPAWKSPSGDYHRNPPDYLNDLNAMHDAEKVLTDEQWDLYCDYLGGSLYSCAHATAAQRAEAFLKAIGKWEEDNDLNVNSAHSFTEGATCITVDPTAPSLKVPNILSRDRDIGAITRERAVKMEKYAILAGNR